jgi:hypothetical protein
MLCGEVDCRDPGCGCDLFLILRENLEEEKIPCLREMTFLHCLVEIKEIALGGTNSGILYNFLFKVIIKL